MLWRYQIFAVELQQDISTNTLWVQAARSGDGEVGAKSSELELVFYHGRWEIQLFKDIFQKV